jgi:hypothetical protein
MFSALKSHGNTLGKISPQVFPENPIGIQSSSPGLVAQRPTPRNGPRLSPTHQRQVKASYGKPWQVIAGNLRKIFFSQTPCLRPFLINMTFAKRTHFSKMLNIYLSIRYEIFRATLAHKTNPKRTHFQHEQSHFETDIPICLSRPMGLISRQSYIVNRKLKIRG